MRRYGMQSNWRCSFWETWRGRILLWCIAVGALFAIFFTAGHAHADTGPFSGPAGDHDSQALWVDVAPFDHTVTVAVAAQLGQLVCSKLDAGYSEGYLIAQGANGNAAAVPAWSYIIHAAEWHYCPTYYGTVA